MGFIWGVIMIGAVAVTAVQKLPDLVLYDAGDEKTAITGGWDKIEGYPGNGGSTTVIFSKGATQLNMRAPYWGSGSYTTRNVIPNLQLYNRLVVVWGSSGGTSLYCHFSAGGVEMVGAGNNSTVIYPSPSVLPINFAAPEKIGVGLGNSDNKTYYVYKVYLTKV